MMSMVETPRYQELLWPAVTALRALGGSASISELDDRVIADQMFTEEQQSVLHGDGPGIEIAYRIAWARSYLKGMGLALNSARGVWALTEAGRSVQEPEIEPLRVEYLRKKRAARISQGDDTRGPSSSDVDSQEPTSWQEEMLDALIDLSPDAFERVCQRLLREAGFSRTRVTGRSTAADGGIDGVGVYRFGLVSFPIFFQAKKWRNAVGAGVVRDFRGAMSGRGEKGLLITTATFTSDAKKEASRDGAPPVDLVDGEQLCALLAEHRIGVRVAQQVVETVTVDRAAIAAI